MRKFFWVGNSIRFVQECDIHLCLFELSAYSFCFEKLRVCFFLLEISCMTSLTSIICGTLYQAPEVRSLHWLALNNFTKISIKQPKIKKFDTHYEESLFVCFRVSLDVCFPIFTYPGTQVELAQHYCVDMMFACYRPQLFSYIHVLSHHLRTSKTRLVQTEWPFLEPIFFCLLPFFAFSFPQRKEKQNREMSQAENKLKLHLYPLLTVLSHCFDQGC